jgi:protease IV
MAKSKQIFGGGFQRLLAAPVAGRAIGKIKLYGPIVPSSVPVSAVHGVNPDRVLQKIRWAESRGIRALVFEMNSPGGSVVPSKEIADCVSALKIPTVAWVRDLAASGAYWIASACDRIVADTCSGIGSIGVISTHIEFSELMKKYGVSYESFKSGEFKDAGVPFRKFTPKERKFIQNHIDAIHARFVNTVAENRGLDPKKISGLADGNLYLGEEAKKMGLVDVIGGRAEAIRQCELLGNFKHIIVAEIEDFRDEFALMLRSLLSMGQDELGRGIGHGIFERLSTDFGINFR